MKARTIILTVMVCMVAAAMCFASDPTMGTWKLNEAKSKVPAGLPKYVTVVYEAAGDKVKITVDGTGADGQPRCEYQCGRVAPKRQLYGQPYMRTHLPKSGRILPLTARRATGGQRTAYAIA